MNRLVSHGDVTQSFLGHHKWLFELGTPEPSQCILQSSHRMIFFCSLAPKVVQTLVMDREPGTRPRCDDIFSEAQRSGSRVTHSLKILKPSYGIKELKTATKINKAGVLSGKLYSCVLCGCCSMDVSGKPGQVPYGTLVLATAMLVAPSTNSALSLTLLWFPDIGIKVCRSVVD